MMTIEEAQELINRNPDFYWGFRTVERDDYNVDDRIFENSKSWHDIATSTLTDEEIEELEERGQVEGSCYWVEELPGVSATNAEDFDDAAAALEYSRRHYCGNVVYLLAADNANFGDDDHEIVMRRPQVIAKF